MAPQDESPRTYRATVGSYVVFCGIWLLLCAANVFLMFLRPDAGAWKGGVITCCVALAAGLWMSGHQIRIASGMLHYRDGFFRSRSIRIEDIKSIAHVWEPVIPLNKGAKVPRLRVRAHEKAQSFSINSKPFSREALLELQKVVGDRGQGSSGN